MDHGGHGMGMGMGKGMGMGMDGHIASSPYGDQPMMHRHRMGMMHMSFYWGSNGIILFTGWPGMRTGMYLLALIMVFALSILVEGFSHARLIRPGTSNVAAGVVQTLMHALRVCLAYVLMLAVMSFNVGVLLVAVAGHALGFLVFGSRLFRKTKCGAASCQNCSSDLPPLTCC